MGFLVTGEVYVDIGDEQLDVLIVEAIALIIDYILNQEGSEYIQLLREQFEEPVDQVKVVDLADEFCE